MNKVFLVGTVANDPELRFTQAGQPILNLRVATVKSWNDKSGAAKERRDSHSVVFWGQRGEALSKILVKDMPVVVEGELQNSSYEKDGQKIWKTEVNASNIEQFSVASGGGGHSGAPVYPSGNPIPFGAPAAHDPYAAHGIDPMTMY